MKKETAVGVTFEYMQYYLPTKRHKNEVYRKMTTEADINVHYIDKKDFPVALRVTDYDLLYHNLDDKEKYDTIEYRWDGKNLYEEPRQKSGCDKGKLEYENAESFIDSLKHRNEILMSTILIGKEYQEGQSVILYDDLDERVERVQKHADDFLICDGKVWRKCGQPYYHIVTFGLGHNHGGMGFFIEWSDEESVDKGDFLATQREIALKEFRRIALGRGDTDSVKHGYPDSMNIEVLIPEAYTLKREVESKQYKGYKWSDEDTIYIKEYGPAPAHKETWEITFSKNYRDSCKAILYTKVEDAMTDTEKAWLVLGQLFEDCRDISFKEISILRKVEDDKDMLEQLNSKLSTDM